MRGILPERLLTEYIAWLGLEHSRALVAIPLPGEKAISWYSECETAAYHEDPFPRDIARATVLNKAVRKLSEYVSGDVRPESLEELEGRLSQMESDAEGDLTILNEGI